MTPFTRIYNRFEYHLEDTECSMCLYWQGKKQGCSLKKCCCDDVRSEAIVNDRIKRKPRWFKRDW